MTGMPQLATSTMLTSVFTQPETRWSSRATSMPTTMVKMTQPAAKTIVRSTTCQNSLSSSTLEKLPNPVHSAGLNPHSWDCPKSWKERVTSR